MVADRQHLASCDSGSPVITTSSKKVRSSTPLNIYRPPALRKRNEALEIPNCDSSPDIVPVSKAERLRPAKQRRPDIQVYVPRAKRILATPGSNSKSTTTVQCTQTEIRKTSSSRKSCTEDSHQTPPKVKSIPDKSSGHHLRAVSDERNDLGITCNYKNNNEKVRSKALHSDSAHGSEPSTCSEEKDQLQCEDDDIEVILIKSGKEQSSKTLDGCSVSLSKTRSSAGDSFQCDEVQRGHSVSVVTEESISGPVLESVNNVSEDVGSSCKTCNSVLRLCNCNSSSFVYPINKSCELSKSSRKSSLSQTTDIVNEPEERVEGTLLVEQNIRDCKLGENKDKLCSLKNTWHAATTEAVSSVSEQDSVLHEVPPEEVEENINSSVSEETTEEKSSNNYYLSEDSVSSDVVVISDSSNEEKDQLQCGDDDLDVILIKSGKAPTMSVDTKESEGDGDTNESSSGTTTSEKLVTSVSSSSENSMPTTSTPIRLNPDECTWEMMFDDSGDCLDPTLMEEITNAVGSVKIEKPKSDYNSYQNKPEIYLDPGDEFSHVVEIYNFPAAFKTEDLVTIFSPYKLGGFEIKWVDNTHALGIFSNSYVAAEVLATEHPFVKTRPLREASHESRMKARRSAEFLQPYRVRPETCAALARRLVTGALGVKVNVTREEREAERRLLREAREKKRLAAKQRDEIWEGTFSAD